MTLMKRKVELCLAFRDMWQTSCGSFPDIPSLVEMASVIVSMGCFSRVETNGGAFEQVCLMNGVDPNHAVREFVKPLKAAGIKAQMLERGLNALSLSPVSADVRELMFKVKKAQGVDVVRSFCGLNDAVNLSRSVRFAKSAGVVSQVALPIVNSPVHTIRFYMSVVESVVSCGCNEICIKDMSGQASASLMAGLIRKIRLSYPEIYIHYHGHCGRQNYREALLEVVGAGVDAVDVAVGPLSGRFSHPDVLDVVDWLSTSGYAVNDVDREAYCRFVGLIEGVCSKCSPSCGKKTPFLDGLIGACGLPGGMMASLPDNIIDFHVSVNSSLRKRGLPEVSLEGFVSQFCDEVKSIWPLLGYPPMVTPFSQYVANAALSNLLALAGGGVRWMSLNSEVWNMILGRMGKLPAEPDASLLALAADKGLEFYDGDPQELYPDTLSCYRSEMFRNSWSLGQDDEQLMELAMHEAQYRSFISGQSSLSMDSDDAAYIAIALALQEYTMSAYKRKIPL